MSYATYKENDIPKTGMIVFTCKCGGTISNNLHNIRMHISAAKENKKVAMYRCPNRLYGKCNRSYAAEQVLEKGTFIRPIEENA